MIDETLLEAEEKMEKAIEVAKEDFAGIRTGRANAGMFSKITVDYYGAPTPLQQLASFNIPDARTVMIAPFDKSSLPAVEKALRDSDLGVNPATDGNVDPHRAALPDGGAPSRLREARQDQGRGVARLGAQHPAQGQGELDRIVKDGEAGEDEVTRAEKELDKLTKSHVDVIDQLLSSKESELLEV